MGVEGFVTRGGVNEIGGGGNRRITSLRDRQHRILKSYNVQEG